ncbi:MAG TPA: CPBP family intramembrane glutamic endopeptidase [Acidobacteriota bacterium]|nr:CPBP family intramembrane glutamic endopeptidase [Acidobacteriota bacterium]
MPILGATSFLGDFWYEIVFKLIFLLIIPWLIYRKLGHRTKDLLFGWRLTPQRLFWLVLAFSTGILLNVVYINEIRSAAKQMNAFATIGRITIGALMALMTAGFPEEFVYRGIIQTRLEIVVGRFLAIITTLILFVAWHLPTRYLLAQGIEGQAGNWTSVLIGTGIPVAIIGLIFGWAWDRFRNLPALIAAHWAIDLLPTVAFFMGLKPH